MIAINSQCDVCKHARTDWACCTDYCSKGHDDVMSSEGEKCTDYEDRNGL